MVKELQPLSPRTNRPKRPHIVKKGGMKTKVVIYSYTRKLSSQGDKKKRGQGQGQNKDKTVCRRIRVSRARYRWMNWKNDSDGDGMEWECDSRGANNRGLCFACLLDMIMERGISPGGCGFEFGFWFLNEHHKLSSLPPPPPSPPPTLTFLISTS